MSKTIRIEVPKTKNRNPLFIGGAAGRQVFKDKRDKRPKDAKRSWQRDNQVNG
jgi:hypothetical protein